MKSKINKRIADIRKARKSKVLKRIGGAALIIVGITMLISIFILPSDFGDELMLIQQIFMALSVDLTMFGMFVVGILLISE